MAYHKRQRHDVHPVVLVLARLVIVVHPYYMYVFSMHFFLRSYGSSQVSLRELDLSSQLKEADWHDECSYLVASKSITLLFHTLTINPSIHQ